MKQTSHKTPGLTVSAGIYFALALLMLLVPLRWVLAWSVSVAVHELFHLAAIRCFGYRILAVHIGIDGARIQTQQMSLWQEWICAMAGPLGGMLLLFLVRFFPSLALCSAFHTLYNLLPVYPQDGGRALRCASRLLLPENIAYRLCNIVEYICFAGVVFLAIYGTFVLKLGIIPILFAALFLQRSRKMKNTLQRG